MLMGAPPSMLQRYVLDVVTILDPMSPVVIYLRCLDVSQALHAISHARGAGWQDYQVKWKVRSPYGRERGLQGFDGLIALYTAYRTICDSIFQILPIPTLLVEHTGDWQAIYRDASQLAGVPDRRRR